MLFTGGLLSVHVNYYGHPQPVVDARPGVPVSFFCFFNIPKLDAYFAERYGAAFTAYASKTKRFIPFVL